jgi:hypothetical protein
MDMSVFTTTQFVLEVVGIVAFALSVIMGMITAVSCATLCVTKYHVSLVTTDHMHYALLPVGGYSY